MNNKIITGYITDYSRYKGRTNMITINKGEGTRWNEKWKYQWRNTSSGSISSSSRWIRATQICQSITKNDNGIYTIVVLQRNSVSTVR